MSTSNKFWLDHYLLSIYFQSEREIEHISWPVLALLYQRYCSIFSVRKTTIGHNDSNGKADMIETDLKRRKYIFRDLRCFTNCYLYFSIINYDARNRKIQNHINQRILLYLYLLRSSKWDKLWTVYLVRTHQNLHGQADILFLRTALRNSFMYFVWDTQTRNSVSSSNRWIIYKMQICSCHLESIVN